MNIVQRRFLFTTMKTDVPFLWHNDFLNRFSDPPGAVLPEILIFFAVRRGVFLK